LPAWSVTVIAVKLPFTGADRAMETGTFTTVPCAIFGTPLSRAIDPDPSALLAVHDDHVIPVMSPVPSADVPIWDGSTTNADESIAQSVETVGRAAAAVGAGVGVV
jgi:hypothetical protein